MSVQTVLTFPRGTLVALILVFVAIAGVSAWADDELMRLYHPLEPGTIWRYHVQEDGESYLQTIEVRSDSKPGSYVLRTASSWRRVSYHITEANGVCLLDRVEAKLSFLPFKRTARFDPPLPFLRFDGELSGRWRWTGRSRGYGPDLVLAEYSMSPVSAEGDTSATPDLEVSVQSTDAEGQRNAFTAVYGAGVGLKSVVAAGYRKTLVHLEKAPH